MKTQTRKNKTTKGQRGFTLIETCIALVVMMVGALGLSSLFVFSMQNNIGGSERALAMAVAQQQLERIRSVDYDDAALNTGTVTSTVSSAKRNYTVQTTVANETNTDGSAKELKRITIRVTPESSGPNWVRTPVVLVSFRSTPSFGDYLVSE